MEIGENLRKREGARTSRSRRKGTGEAWRLRGRFGVRIPPLMEALGLVELERNAKGNRMRAK